jgi:hypothetical protein
MHPEATSVGLVRPREPVSLANAERRRGCGGDCAIVRLCGVAATGLNPLRTSTYQGHGQISDFRLSEFDSLNLVQVSFKVKDSLKFSPVPEVQVPKLTTARTSSSRDHKASIQSTKHPHP